MKAEDVSRTTLYQGRKFRLDQFHAPGTDGKVHDYDVIVHPGAAVILPILDDGRVVLIQNERIAVGRKLLELPAGTIDLVDGSPEPAAECARRELTEETGYTAGRMEPLISFLSSPGICSEELHAFLATDLKLGQTAHEPGERIEVLPMDYREALRAIGDGTIADGKTIVTLLYYENYVRNAR